MNFEASNINALADTLIAKLGLKPAERSSGAENAKPVPAEIPQQAQKYYVPIWEKPLLTLEEAVAYFGICAQKIRDITNDENLKLVMWNGSKRMIKRVAMEKYLNEAYSI